MIGKTRSSRLCILVGLLVLIGITTYRLGTARADERTPPPAAAKQAVALAVNDTFVFRMWSDGKVERLMPVPLGDGKWHELDGTAARGQ